MTSSAGTPTTGKEADVIAQVLALPGDWHGSGSLDAVVLDAIARHARALPHLSCSLETGAGKSTLLLSQLAARHLVFAIDKGESLSRVRESPLLAPERVTFVDGPTQRTLARHAFDSPLQLVLLDGPHAFPFPQLEYFHVYPHIDPGGLLIIDDIHIPSVGQLQRFLDDEDMFERVETVAKTAFYRRTDRPTFDPYGDGWATQGINRGMQGRLRAAQRMKRAVLGERKLPTPMKRVFWKLFGAS